MVHGWRVTGSSFVAYGVSLLATSNVLAHGGSHGEDEPEQSAAPSNHHRSTYESDVNETYTPAQGDTHEGVMSQSDMSVNNAGAHQIQEVSTSQAVSSLTLSAISGSAKFSLGLGESLLGLIVAGPLLLVSLKRHIQS